MKIVVAIDSPESAQTALEYLSSGKFSKADDIHLVHVIVPQFADMPVAGIPDVIAEEREAEQKLLGELAIAINEKLGTKPSIDILYGETAELIAERCKHYNADEAIVPSHARHGFSRLWFGSVADDIVDAAPCTVVVLKMPAHH